MDAIGQKRSSAFVKSFEDASAPSSGPSKVFRGFFGTSSAPLHHALRRRFGKASALLRQVLEQEEPPVQQHFLCVELAAHRSSASLPLRILRKKRFWAVRRSAF